LVDAAANIKESLEGYLEAFPEEAGKLKLKQDLDRSYKIGYENMTDVLTVVLKGKGELSHAMEMGDFIVHVDTNDEPCFWRY
jgi:hypothetical protein